MSSVFVPKRIVYVLLYILIIFSVSGVWFMEPGYLFFTDMVWGPNRLIIDYSDNWLFLNSILKLLAFVFPLAMVEKIFLTMTISTIVLSGRLVVKNFISDPLLVFSTSMFFLFNPFIYDRLLYGQIGVALSFAFFCGGFGYFLVYIGNGRLKYMLYTAFFWAFAVQLSAHFIFMVALMAPFLFIVRIPPVEWRSNFLKAVTVLLLIIFLCNANWILNEFFVEQKIQTFINEGISTKDAVAFQTAGRNSIETITNVFMMSGFWGKDQFRYLDLTKGEMWARSFIFIFPLVIAGVYTGYRNNEFRIITKMLLIVFVAAATLAVGAKVPFAREITSTMFEYVPFYKGMRETQKWVAVIVLIYGVFLALGVRMLFAKKFFIANKVMLACFLGGVIIMQAPLLLWGFGGQVKPVDYPTDWYQADEMIRSGNGCERKILFLPWHMYMSFSWIGGIVANPANKFFSCPVVQGTNMEFGGIYNNSLDPTGKEVENWIAAKGNTDLLIDESIGHIIIAKEIDWQQYVWVKELEDVVLKKETDTLQIYEVGMNTSIPQ